MYKIKLLYDVLGWAYYWRCEALRKYAPEDFRVDTGLGNGPYSNHEYDLVLQLSYGHTHAVRKHLRRMGHNTVLVAGFNVGWTPCNEGWFDRVCQVADAVIINSRQCAEKPTGSDRFHISNGVDLDVFRATERIQLGRPPKVIFVGSRYHCLPDRDTKRYWAFLKPLAESLDRRGIDHEFRVVESCGLLKMVDGKPVARTACYKMPSELLRFYNSGSVYVVASTSEGTPNPALEAAACGCTVCATSVGNMPELIEPYVNGELVGHTFDELETGVLRCVERAPEYAAAMQETIQGWSWAERAKEYYALFRELIDCRR